MGPLANIPVIVLTHGKPFPNPFSAIEPIWLPGQKREAALSPQGRLEVARRSNHMIAMDEPQLVIAAIREVAADLVPSAQGPRTSTAPPHIHEESPIELNASEFSRSSKAGNKVPGHGLSAGAQSQRPAPPMQAGSAVS
jgi:hypothetical protein